MSCGIVDDIEDILKTDENESEFDRSLNANKSFVVPKAKSKRLSKDSHQAELAQLSADSVIPGVASIYIKTWGCTHNSSDSEYMAGQLASYGYRLVDNPDEANLWLLNSCTVKNPAEDHFRNYIEKAAAKGKYVVLAGCVPQGAPKLDYIQGFSVIGVQQIDRIVEVVEETLKGNSVRLFSTKKKDGKKYGGASLSLPKVRRNPLIEIISINTGCLNQCTYCKTKHARGELGSYSPEEIVDRVKQSFQEGVCEIWLTSEDTGAYGKDIGVSIVQLLWKIIEHVPENCMLRIGMTNPPYILEHLEEMAKILSHPRVYAFLHIPVQSGSDAVLGEMKREYFVEDFRRIVDYLREKVPGINIATDIICGFPTETEEDFEKSLVLVRDYKFSTLFINQFFPRPGTPAAKMKQIATAERKRRTKLMSELFQSYTSYDNKVGQRFRALVTELSSDSDYYVGHNKFYEQVLVPKLDELMGNICEIEIMECGKYFMKGRLVSEDSIIRIEKPVAMKPGQVTGRLESIRNSEAKTNGECGGCDEDSCSTAETRNEKSNGGLDLYDYAYGALIGLSVLFIARVSWRFFMQRS